MTSHSPYPIYVASPELKAVQEDCPAHVCTVLDGYNVGNGSEHIVLEWDGGAWYCGDSWGEGVSHILYCPWCGQKLEEPKGE